ncbi:MAG: EamA/RhaT family transporter, partial [Deltaproteobacteria bacterium]
MSNDEVSDLIAQPDVTDVSQVVRGLLWAFIGLLVFSGWFAVTRLVVTGDLRVWDVVALRLGGGTLVLLPVLLFRCRHLPWAAWRSGFVLAMLWGAPFVLLVAGGLRLTSAAAAASVTPGLMPVFAGVAAWFLSGVRPPGRRLAGYGVIVAGLVGLIAVGAGDATGPVGLGCLVLAAAGWAAYTLRLGGSGLDPLQAAWMICFWSAALYLPLYMLSGVTRLPEAPLHELAFQGIYQGAL